METFRYRCSKLAIEAEEYIKQLLTDCKIHHLVMKGITSGCTPYIFEDTNDDEYSYALVRITLENGSLSFIGSNSIDTAVWHTNQIPTDKICAIADFIKSHEDYIRTTKIARSKK